MNLYSYQSLENALKRLFQRTSLHGRLQATGHSDYISIESDSVSILMRRKASNLGRVNHSTLELQTDMDSIY